MPAAEVRHRRLCGLINQPRLAGFASFLDREGGAPPACEALSGATGGAPEVALVEGGPTARDGTGSPLARGEPGASPAKKKKVRRKRMDLKAGLQRKTVQMMGRHVPGLPPGAGEEGLATVTHTWSKPGALGLKLKAVSTGSLDEPAGVYVAEVTREGVPGAMVGRVVARLTAGDGTCSEGLEGRSYNEVLALIKTAGRPLTMGFEEPPRRGGGSSGARGSGRGASVEALPGALLICLCMHTWRGGHR